jgi:peptidoglycan/xylan/chitin deacetylase (PgdA/CDA1 family)
MGMRARRSLALAAHHLGLFRAAGSLFGGRRLTVLAYHRVVEHRDPAFDTYRRNVSATPSDFVHQMDYLTERFHPVSLVQVEAALDGGRRLPRRPLLVTFDDGYRDNLLTALPILQERGIPMTLFLASGFVGGGRPFPWDLAAWCFHHTTRRGADLPVLGERAWAGPRQREQTLIAWLETLKHLPDETRQEAVEALPERLGVTVPPGVLKDLCVSWDEVRVLADAGVSFGAHTESHPILTRVSKEQARREITGSKQRLEEELGRPVRAFAYPNGGQGDFDQATVGILAAAGFHLGFTLLPGPARAAEARRAPLTLRRVYVHYKDHPARFAAKVNGFPRLPGVSL